MPTLTTLELIELRIRELNREYRDLVKEAHNHPKKRSNEFLKIVRRGDLVLGKILAMKEVKNVLKTE